jgi:hypothetical protein
MKPLDLPLFPKDIKLITCGGEVLIIFICVVCVLSERGNPVTVARRNPPNYLGQKCA